MESNKEIFYREHDKEDQILETESNEELNLAKTADQIMESRNGDN
jgi:hypothetical protein